MKDVIIGVDAGTSVIKSVAFNTAGEQLAVSTVPNSYRVIEGGAAEQDLQQTWINTLTTLKGLKEKIDNLNERLVAISVTGQGDGTWLIDENGDGVCPAWLWLDSRAAEMVETMRNTDDEKKRFSICGTGINTCQQGAQLRYMLHNLPQLLEKTETAFHCKDWLYFKLTGVRATDPSEGCFTFGDYKTREYSEEVIGLSGLDSVRSIIPPMLDGSVESHALTASAAKLTGLAEGTPVVLGFVDIICTALGAGLYHPENNMGCTIVGSTGVHLNLARSPSDVVLNDRLTGYTMAMPIDGHFAMLQTNMASTINIDWLLSLLSEFASAIGGTPNREELISRLDEWIGSAQAGSVLYQPYISEAGERGPFIDSTARAGFIGLSNRHGFTDLIRSVVEGLAFASRDCYLSMGVLPERLCLTGGAAHSGKLREIFGSVLGAEIITSERKEAGAAGAAMIAAVNLGCYETMDACVESWVSPYLSAAEPYDKTLHELYKDRFTSYQQVRSLLPPVWKSLVTDAGRDNA